MALTWNAFAQPKIGDYQCINSGNWSDLANWERFDGTTLTWETPTVVQGYPGQYTGTGNVTIQAGNTVTINASPANAVGSLLVEATGILQYEAVTARTLRVSDIVRISPGGTFTCDPAGTVTNHELIVEAGIVNEGILNFSANSAGVGITFSGSSNGKFDLSAANMTNLMASNGLILNKGAYVLSFTPGGTFQVQSGNAVGFLTIQSGTFSLMGENGFSNPLFYASTGNYTIPSAGGFRLDNPNATIVGMYGTLTNDGELIVRRGIYNIGTGSGNESLTNSTGRFEMSGGEMNISGRFRISDGNCIISGGTLNLATIGHANRTLAAFHSSPSADLTMSGDPLITFAFPNTNSTPFNDLAIEAGTGLKTITGGTFQMGTAATPATRTFLVNSDVPIHNLVIYNANARVSLNNHLTITNQLTLNGRLLMNTYNLEIGTPAIAGSFGINGGMIVTGTGQVHKTMNATGSYLFPLGNGSGSTPYLPVTLDFIAGTFTPGATVSVGMVNSKHPKNVNITNYLKRYWTIRTTGITNPLYNFTGHYVSVDLIGSEAFMRTGIYTSGWKKTNPLINFTVSATGLRGDADISGINVAAPVVTTNPADTTICRGSSFTLRAVASGSGNLTYSWSPAAGLNFTNISNPTANPTTTTLYTVTVTDDMNESASASIVVTVTDDNTISLTSATGTDSQTLCINTPITTITYATIGATGATVTGLPDGVTGSWADNVVTISGTPTVGGPALTYTITLTGGCGTVTTTGTIAVTDDNMISLASATGTDSQTSCINTSITPITYATIGATGATVTGLPDGVTGSWADNVVTISGTPITAGPALTYTVTLTGGCGEINTTGTITVIPDNTISMTSEPGTESQTTCINTSIIPITYATTSATGANVTGLPDGVTGSWADNVVTISGTPTVAGPPLTYTVNLIGGCGIVTTTGTITVSQANTIALSSATGTNAQIVCLNTPITPITYITTGATGATVTNLPTGVTGSWAGNVVTISGTPTVAGAALTYTVTLTGGCGVVTANGIITVSPVNTIALSSAPNTNPQTVCINTAITPITFTTTGATGAGVSGLPAGVTLSFVSNTVTITGAPAASGTFNYTVTLTGGCGVIRTTGTITVTPNNTIALSSATGTNTQTVCLNNPIIPITYTTSGATGADFNSLPPGVTGSWADNVVTISGTPTAPGPFTYRVTLTGGCGAISTTGTITVNPNNTIVLGSAPGTDSQNICINTGLTLIRYNTIGATGAQVDGLPTGVTFNLPSNQVRITGTPTISGTFHYTITLTGGCGNVTANGTIIVKPIPSLTSSLTATICSGNPFSYDPQSDVDGTTFNWFRIPVGGITSPGPNFGTGNPNQILINSTGSSISVIYRYTLLANGCSRPQDVVVTVSPGLTLNSPLVATTCSNSPINYTPGSSIPGVSFSWSRALMAGISNAAATGTGNITETLVNTTPANVVVPYVYTLILGGCPNTQTVNITVRPTPELSSSLTPPAICNNTAFTYTPTSLTGGTTFNWIRNAIPGISNAAAAGVNGISETLINTTANPIAVTYVYTLRSNNCNNPQNVVVTVNPTPTLSSSHTPPAVCSNSLFRYSPTSLTSGTTYSWTCAPVAGISSHLTSGTGDVNEILVNTTPNPIVVRYVYTLAANGCTNTATENVDVVVNPLPTVTTASVNPNSICVSGQVTFTATASSGTIKWFDAPIGGTEITVLNPVINSTTTYYAEAISNGCVSANRTAVTATVYGLSTTPTITASGPVSFCSGGSVTLTSSAGVTYLWSTGATTASINVTTSGSYTVQVTDGNGCLSASSAPTVVTVSPLPTITITPSSVTICAGSSVELTASGASTYAWSPEVGLSANNEATVTASPTSTTTYTVVGTDANGCINIQSVHVTVRPRPELTSTNDPTICSGTLFSYSPQSSISGTSFSWSRSTVAGISPATSSGTGNINETLTNTTASPIGVRYIYTLTLNGCTNTGEVDVVVIPAPTVTAVATPSAICEGGSTQLTSSYNVVTAPPPLPSWNFNGSTTGWTATHFNTNSLGGNPANSMWALRPDGYTIPVWLEILHSNDNSQFYLSNGYSQGGSTTRTETYLTSPSFSTVGYTTLSLNFWHYYLFGNVTNESASVQVSTDGTTWTTEATFTSTQGAANGFVNAVVDLNFYINRPTVYIRFRNYSTRQARYWAIDNVQVTGTSPSPVISWSSVPAGYSSNVANPPAAVSPAVTTTYTVTYTDPTADPEALCSGSGSVTVTVNPSPTMSSASTATVCSGGTLNIPLTASAPSTFTWIATDNPNVTGESLSIQTTGTLNNTLINTSSAVQVVNYAVTPIATAGLCAGTPQTVSVTVNPAPTVSNAAFNQGGPYCNGNTGNSINFSSNVPTATYAWTSTNDIGFGTSGIGNIPVYVATNTSNSPVTTTVNVSATADGCPGPVRTFTITVNPTPAATITADYCIRPGYIRLTATGGGTYSWIPGGQTTSSIDVDIAGDYGVTVTNLSCQSTVYLGVAEELVTNGNFSAGNTSFFSGYTYYPDVAGNNELVPDNGTNGYGVGTNGQNYHYNFWGQDHTGNTSGPRNFMLVNGHGTIEVWRQTVPVVPGLTYYFSAWAISLNSVGPFANLQFRINGGSPVGFSTGPLPARPENNGPAPWRRFYGNWTAPAGVTLATISIVDLQTAAGGNDFGLDDISFGTLDDVPSTIDPEVVGGNNSVCAGSTITLTPNVTGGRMPYSFVWTGPNSFTSTDSIAVISNATTSNAGTYTVTVRDGYGCGTGVSASTAVVVNSLPVCSITGATTICPGSTGNTYTAPAGMTGYVWTVSAGGAIVGSATNSSVSITVGAGCSSSFTLSLAVTNGTNCSSTCTQIINVQDNTTPLIVGTLSATTIQGCAAAAAPSATTVAQLEAMAGSITITDACTSDALLTVSSTDVVNGTCPIVITRTYTITDACNNSVTIDHVITVQDTSPPVVAGTLTDITIEECSATAPVAATTVAQLEAMAGSITINDACTPKASLTVSNTDVVSGTCPIIVTRTYSVRDACNNSVTIVQNITVQDTTAPVVVGTLTGLILQGCTATTAPVAVTTVAQLEAMAGSITINDACTPKASLTVSYTDVVSGTCPIIITRTYTVRDACNNSVAIVHVITVQDTTAPTWVTPLGALNEYLECGDAAGLAAAQARRPVATDICDLSLVVVKQTSGTLVSSGTCSAGTYTNTYRVTDACGNQVAADYTQIITIEDNSDPVITVPPTATLTCLDDPTNLSVIGTATATDNCGNAPVFGAGITYSDNTILTTCTGDYKIERTWTATDECGHTSSAMQEIYIQDVDGPVISALPDPYTIDCNDTPVFEIATAYDACASTYTLTFVDITTAETCANAYSVTRTWTATDACNNVSTATQTIHVQDIFAPVITGTLTDLNIEGCGLDDAPAAVTTIAELEALAGGITVADACTPPESLEITSSDVASGSCPIVLTRTYTITDACDLSSTITQLINISNTTATTFTFCPPSFSTLTDEGETYATLSLALPVYSDGCGTPVSLTWSIVNGTTTTNGVGTIPLNTQFQIGTNNITYTATNACGNFSTCNFTITVSPNDLPVISCPPLLDVSTDFDLCTATLSPTSPTITFGTPPIELGWTIEYPAGTIIDSGTGSIGSFTFNTGTTIINWTASNIVGSVGCSQTITVIDRQNPEITCPASPPAICANSAGTYTHGSDSWDTTATDNCSVGSILYTLSGATTGTGSSLNGVVFNTGTTTVLWRATDAAGNFDECTFDVIVHPLPTPSLIYHN